MTGAGRVRFHIDAEGYVTETVYNGAGLTANVKRYGRSTLANGGLLEKTDRYTEAPTEEKLKTFVTSTLSLQYRQTETEYDDAGRVSQVKISDQAGNVASLTRTEYYADGKVHRVTTGQNSQASTTEYAYDGAGRLVAEQRGLNVDDSSKNQPSLTLYEYDGVGNRIATYDARGLMLEAKWQQMGIDNLI